MLRLVLVILLFIFSLLIIFTAPTKLLWYVSILITEFSWIFFVIVVVLLLPGSGGERFSIVTNVAGFATLILLSLPIIGAFRLSNTLKSNYKAKFNVSENSPAPFTFLNMFSGMRSKPVAFNTKMYASDRGLSLDFYPASSTHLRPCVIVVHGGSWAGGDSKQLPELNSELAKAGFHVASINYRLAPRNTYPAPIEDVKSALTYLKANAEVLLIDTSNFVLLGRSAGGQIVLSAAHHLMDPGIKGVISFYGPTDMIWGYANPTSPLVLNSRKVMEDYLGGTFEQVPQQYVHSSATKSVSPQSIPTLLIYGKHDPLVSHIHGEKLSMKLDQFGVHHYELYLPWATHGFDWSLHGPGGQLSTWSVLRFLESTTSRTRTD